MNAPPAWPTDADGDVFRRLEAKGFDFGAEYEIDFNVDFDDWPPHRDAVAWLESRYSKVKIWGPEPDFSGYVQFKLRSKLTYALVMDVQREATAGTREYGGICESWGVLQPGP